MKRLVVYYSLSGNTEAAAKKIAEKLKNGNQVFDQELFSALRFYNDNNK